MVANTKKFTKSSFLANFLSNEKRGALEAPLLWIALSPFGDSQ